MKIFKLLNTLGLVLLMSFCLGSYAQTGDEDEPNYRNQVQIMYVAYYGRPGDAGGLDFWAGKLEEVNGNLEEIINEFGTSKEFTDRFGDLDDEELVNNIFLQLLGRPADSGGLNFYVNGLREGRFTLASIALRVVDGTKQNPGGGDAATVANKLQAAKAFSEAYVEADAPYGEFQIDDAKLWLGEVDSTAASVTAALDRLPDLLEMFTGRTIRRPDLEVGSPSVRNTSPTTGSSFTLSATVRNAGDEDSVATTLRYYRSADATISASDTQVGTDAVGALAASGSSAELVALTAPSTVGTYYYGACVDAVTRESNTANNCSASVRVEVEEPEPQTSPGGGGNPPPQQPDLAVVAFFLASGVHDGAPGRSLTFQGRIRNVGNVVSPATMLRFYSSRNRTITTDDTFLGTVAVGTIAASRRIDSETLTLMAPSEPGTYYYGACVDAVTDESDTTNNCSDARPITVDGPPPDLVVTGSNVGDLGEDGTFWLLVTVSNQGAGGAAATTVRYKRSTVGTITTSDTTVGTDAVNTLFPAGGYGATIKLTAPSTPGTYYYGGCVDAVPRESDTTNNCSSAASLVVN